MREWIDVAPRIHASFRLQRDHASHNAVDRDQSASDRNCSIFFRQAYAFAVNDICVATIRAREAPQIAQVVRQCREQFAIEMAAAHRRRPISLGPEPPADPITKTRKESSSSGHSTSRATTGTRKESNTCRRPLGQRWLDPCLGFGGSNGAFSFIESEQKRGGPRLLRSPLLHFWVEKYFSGRCRGWRMMLFHLLVVDNA
jgi:hypothetical protein